MKYLKQFLIIILVSCIGELLYYLLPFPIPATIYGLLIMLGLLILKIVPLAAVKETAEFLIDIMPVMFIPAGVGLIVLGILLCIISAKFRSIDKILETE